MTSWSAPSGTHPTSTSRVRSSATSRSSRVGRPIGVPRTPSTTGCPSRDGSFALDADPLDGTRFFLLARIETAREELFCETIALPEMRVDEDGKRVVASTGEPLPPKHVVVDTSTPCSYY